MTNIEEPRAISINIFQDLAKLCPVTASVNTNIITVVVDEQHLLGKRFAMLPNGSIEKKSAVAISRGIACQFHVPDHETFQHVLMIVSDNPNAAIINAGWKPVEVGEPFIFLSQKALDKLGLDPEAVTTDNGMTAFARLKIHATPSTWQLLDRDEDVFTPEWATKQTFNEWLKNLDKVLPGVMNVKMLRAHSSSSRVLRPDGTAVGGGNGHIWIKVKDASDTDRTRTAIKARSIEHNLAWHKARISKSTGQECGRGFATIVDPSVWTHGRLVFVGLPSCSNNLRITEQKIELIDCGVDALDTSQAIISPLKTFQAASSKGVKIRISAKGSGYRSVENNLRLNTEIELEDGSIKTVCDLAQNYTKKIRCQAPFRASSSFAAFLALNQRGEPFIYDSGTDTTHTLTQSNEIRNVDSNRDSLILEVRNQLGKIISSDYIGALTDEDVLSSAWDSSFFISGSFGKIAFLNHSSDLIELSVSDFSKFGLSRTFGSIINTDLLGEIITESKLDKDEVENLHGCIKYINDGHLLIEYLKLYKQAKSLKVTVDMFAKHGFLNVTDNIAAITFPHRRFVPKTTIDNQIVDKVVADYLLHFPEFLEFLNLILHARYATDRRNAFVWLHSPSSWGKGFLVAIFMALQLVVEVQPDEIDKALAGGPVGLSLVDTLRAWILFVDEFKKASRELKLLNSQITISPKNQLRCVAPLFTKLFASAESVQSLVGDGTEEQFNNRFVYLSPVSRDQKLEDRTYFKEVGKAVYIAAIVSFVADFLNAGVDRLSNLGAIESSREADTFLDAYQSSKRLNVAFGNLADTIEEIIEEIRRCLIDYGRWPQTNEPIYKAPLSVQGLGTEMQNMLKRKTNVGWVSVGEGSKQRHLAIVLSDPVSFIRGYLALSENRSTVGKLQYKADLIAESLHIRKESYKGKVRVYQLQDNNLYKVIANVRGVVVFLDHQPADIAHYEYPSGDPFSE